MSTMHDERIFNLLCEINSSIRDIEHELGITFTYEFSDIQGRLERAIESNSSTALRSVYSDLITIINSI